MSQLPYSIRQAVLTDLPILRQLEQGVVEAERPFAAHLRPGPATYYDIEGLIASADSAVIVVESNSRLIACGFARIDDQKAYYMPAKICYIGLMYVEPQFRGMGLISKVFEALAQWSKNQGVAEYKLDVYAENSSAIKAYEKLGFKASLIEMRLGADSDHP